MMLGIFCMEAVFEHGCYNVSNLTTQHLFAALDFYILNHRVSLNTLVRIRVVVARAVIRARVT